MASSTSQGAALLNGWRRTGRFDKGLASKLPAAYIKFWREWKVQTPAAVHYVPKEGNFERNEVTGEVHPIQNVPLPLQRVREENFGIWGGEAIIKGFQKRNPYKRRVPHFWVPVLKRSVVHSAILNEFFSMTITERTLRLIHSHYGFDHYLLMTPACDLRSLLALKLKKRMLQELQAGCPQFSENPQKQKEVLKEYGKYLEQYSPEEIEWYALNFQEAINKICHQLEAENPVVPHKIIFREKLIEQLKEAGIREADDGTNATVESGAR